MPKWIASLIGKYVGKKLKLEDGPMDGTKKWYTSKGIWTGIVTIIIGILTFVDQNFNTSITTSPVYATIITILGAIGLYSRKTADKTIE